MVSYIHVSSKKFIIIVIGSESVEEERIRELITKTKTNSKEESLIDKMQIPLTTTPPQSKRIMSYSKRF